MNKYRDQILASVSTERLRGSPTLGSRPGKLWWIFFFPSSFPASVAHSGPKRGVKRERKLFCGSFNTNTPRVTPLRSRDPHIHTASTSPESLTLDSGIRFESTFPAPASPQKSPARLLNGVPKASRRRGRCVKTARRSAWKSLCETRARCPLHKVPRFLFRGAHISDVLLFLRRGEGGREGGECVSRRKAFLERDPADSRAASASHCLHPKSVCVCAPACRARTPPRQARMNARNV